MGKRLFCSLVALVLCLSLWNVAASAIENDHFSVGDLVSFGTYPQSLVESYGLIQDLDMLPKGWQSYDYYSGAGTWNDGSMQSSDFMQYADVELDGVRYRAVTFSAYRPYSTGIAGTVDTSYQRVNGYVVGGVYYFKYEPLFWRVLNPETGMVMSALAVDSQPYQNFVTASAAGHMNAQGHFASDWETSSIRAWLNEDFMQTAFTTAEQGRLKETTLQNKSVFADTYNSADTVDKVFLLSYQDALNSSYGFANRYSTYDKARQLQSTDYAKIQGCASNTEAAFLGNCWWLLRSPSDSGYIPGVTNNGRTNSHYSYVNDTFGGVVPVVNLDGLVPCGDHQYEKIKAIEPTGLKEGTYTFVCANCGHVYTETVSTAHLPGDVNGDGAVNLKDAATLKRYLADWEVSVNLKNADVNGDNDVSLMDVVLIERYLAGWKIELK